MKIITSTRFTCAVSRRVSTGSGKSQSPKDWKNKEKSFRQTYARVRLKQPSCLSNIACLSLESLDQQKVSSCR